MGAGGWGNCGNCAWKGEQADGVDCPGPSANVDSRFVVPGLVATRWLNRFPGEADGGVGAGVLMDFGGMSSCPAMIALRFLHPDCVDLDFAFTPREPAEVETEGMVAKRLARDKEDILRRFAELLDKSGAIVNVSKLHRDLVNRERKATTAFVPGFAVPHVRSLQVRRFVMGLVRTPAPGIPFDSLDGEPTRFFVLLASPPYDDRLYLQVYREFAQVVQAEGFVEGLTAAKTTQDVFNLLRDVFQ